MLATTAICIKPRQNPMIDNTSMRFRINSLCEVSGLNPPFGFSTSSVVRILVDLVEDSSYVSFMASRGSIS